MSETEFDEIFARIRERHLSCWADPRHHIPGEINSWDDGRGVYFDDPNGHVLEIITRPYGSGGTAASRPHPLVMQRLEHASDSGERTRRNTGASGEPNRRPGGRVVGPKENPSRA